MPAICSQAQLHSIVAQLRDALQPLFPGQNLDVILFGSYARNEADDGSDINLLVLVDAPREQIVGVSWRVGDAAAELLMDYGFVVSPIIENRYYFHANARVLPFFRSIEREGVRINA